MFMVRHNISKSTFGKMSGSGEKFVYGLEKGHDVRVSTIERVVAWMTVCDKEGLPEKPPARRSKRKRRAEKEKIKLE